MAQLSENSLNHILDEAISSLFPGLTNSENTGFDYYSYTEPMPNLIPIESEIDTSDVSNNQISHIQLFNNIIEGYQQNIRQYQENMNSILTISNRVMNERRVVETYIDIPLYRRDLSNSIIRSRRERDATNTNRDTIPTPIQVFQATETFVYSNAIVMNNPVCPISLDAFREGDIICRIKHCNHAFKQLEIIKWFSRKSLCPVCRHDICA